jgi:hypothetical protein
MSQLKPGTRLKSAVCDTTVMVISMPAGAVEVTCGGVAMIAINDEAPAGVALDPGASEGTQLGKRYTNEAGDLELLCNKPGKGSLAADGTPLAIKGAKPLPSSD